MSISAHFIERPIATTLSMASIVLVGLLALRELPVSALPATESPVIEVTTSMPGAGPLVMASSVTSPLESYLSQIPGLFSISSSSTYGASSITLQFALDRNLDSAAQDVQSAISAAAGQLPRGLPNPPVYNKVNPADAPVMMLAVTSPRMSLPRINDFVETYLVQKLSQIDGVGLVSVGGNQKRSINIVANPAALAARGLSLAEIRTAIEKLNVNAPKGNIDDAGQSYAITVDDQVLSADRYRDLVIAHSPNAPLRLGEVATVEEGLENRRLSGWHNGKPAILLSIQRQPGANVIATVDRVNMLLSGLRASLPTSLQIEIVSDRSTAIRASVRGVGVALLYSTIIVIGVIFVFLRRSWATIIPSTALPLSLIGATPIVYLAGFSINNLTLMAVTVAAGFVVDDAIVMVENIFRHLEAGEAPPDAARRGASQISFTIISLTVSLIAVFIPLLFMGGPVGRLLHEFSMTLSIAVIISAVVSLTFTPMLCAHLLSKATVPQDNASGGASAHSGSTGMAFSALAAGYERALLWAMRNRGIVHASTLISLVATVALFIVIPKGLLPQQDNGVILAIVDAAEDISYSALLERQRQVTEIAMKDPDVASVQSFTGSHSGAASSNSAKLFLTLKSFEARTSSIAAIRQRLDLQFARLVGVSVYMQNPQELTLDSQASRTQYQLKIQDLEPGELDHWAPVLVAALAGKPALADVASDQNSAGKQLVLTIHRDWAALRGVSVQAIDDVLHDAFGERQISTIYTHQNQYHVILEAETKTLITPILEGLFVKSETGDVVPLSVLVDLTIEPATLSIAHLGRFPVVTLSFNVAPGHALGDAMLAVTSAAAEIGLPPRVSLTFAGAAAEFGASLQNQPFLILTSILIVYIVLGMLYESYIHPITILSTLPSAGLGALSGLMAFGFDLDVVSLVGIILLIGIVKKNAIMMIDFAVDMERNEGATAEKSILEACRLRFRPIMMTTMAALLGALPLAFDQNIGQELRRPLGVAIVGGLLVSQFLTLFSTPLIYLALHRFSHGVTAWWHTRLNQGGPPGNAPALTE